MNNALQTQIAELTNEKFSKYMMAVLKSPEFVSLVDRNIANGMSKEGAIREAFAQYQHEQYVKVTTTFNNNAAFRKAYTADIFYTHIFKG